MFYDLIELWAVPERNLEGEETFWKDKFKVEIIVGNNVKILITLFECI